jgi:two-component system NtrC family sensor kinase
MNFKNNRILIVDDNPSIHEDFQKIFIDRINRVNPSLDKLSSAIFGEEESSLKSNLKFELDFAFQGKEAYEKVVASLKNNTPYSMAFMDVRMPPGWDGIETIKKIWEVDSRIQMVICTAYSDYSWVQILETIEHSESLLILKKPFESMEVLQMAYSLTTRWSLARQVELKGEELEALIKLRTNELNEKTKTLYETEKLASVGVLAGGVAHEFNNINAVVLGFTEVALMNKSIDAKSREYFEKIKTAGLRGKKITKNLLLFAGKGVFDKKNVNLKDLVGIVITLLQKEASFENVIITKEFENIPMIKIDQGMITQVLLNLLKNALEAMAEMEVKNLNIKGYFDKEWVYIAIADSGSGIPNETLKNIFDPFYSTKGPYSKGDTHQAKFQGTGLGLSVSHAIVASHNGDIDVQSIENQGSVFTIKLPNIRD